MHRIPPSTPLTCFIDKHQTGLIAELNDTSYITLMLMGKKNSMRPKPLPTRQARVTWTSQSQFEGLP